MGAMTEGEGDQTDVGEKWIAIAFTASRYYNDTGHPTGCLENIYT